MLPLFFTLGMTMDSERFRDPYVPLPIHRDMDDRLTAYVPIHVATLAVLDRLELSRDPASETAALAVADRWASGLASGRLLPAMPARYGDDSIEGPKAELLSGALTLSANLIEIGRRKGATPEGRRYLLAALAPLRAVRFSDLRTMMLVPGRYTLVAAALQTAGDSQEAARIKREGVVGGPGARTLLAHLACLRAEYRTHFAASLDAASLRDADTAYECALERGNRLHVLLTKDVGTLRAKR